MWKPDELIAVLIVGTMCLCLTMVIGDAALNNEPLDQEQLKAVVGMCALLIGLVAGRLSK